MIEGPDCGLWVEVEGSGVPVTVFAHGVTSSIAELKPLAARAPGTRVLFDFRGHGRSESPDAAAGYDHAAMRRDLAHVADRYEATQAFGVSMGAGALMSILEEEPDRFERLVFFIPASIDVPNEGSPVAFPAMAHMLETYPLEEVVARTIDAPAQAPLFATRPYWRALWRDRIMRMNATGIPRALRAYVSGTYPVKDADALRQVRAPALILAHEHDPVHDAKIARRLAALLPNATLKVWPEPLSMYDDVDSFAALIGAFLGGEMS
ncbi:MAG TPA: alpha/beta hydrolase [Actinomycetota bacterium]|nr:alpha/beta hydrolase [Actinomycetota bacterium]